MRLLPLIALAVASVVAGPAVPASASVTFTSASFFIPLNIPPPFGPPDTQVITGPGFTMQQGETRRVTEQLDVSVNTDIGPEINNALLCTDPAGNEIDLASAGTNDVGNPGQHRAWRLSALLTAGMTGTYTCGIQTYAHDSHSSDFQMTVWPMTEADGTSAGTWLQVSSVDQAGAHQWVVYPDNSCPTQDPVEDGHCRYIGGPNGAPQADFFQPPAVEGWTAGNDATTIDATGVIQVTSCPNGTDSCPPTTYGSEHYAIAETYMEVDQLYPDGSACQVNRDYGWTPDGQPGSYFIVTSAVHHEPLSYHLSAPVSQNCAGSRAFRADLHFHWVAGDPVKLENGNVNVINSVRATTTTVPDVLHGNQGQADTEGQADAAIQGAGLTVAPAYVMSPAPLHTVISQNSPGNTIEPAGSPVQITVSLGQATVPNVLSYDQASAEQAIQNAGLTIDTPGHVNNCIDPGTVQSQHPSAGVQVPLGTTMHIDVSTCTSGGSGGGNNGGNPHQRQ